MMDGDSLCKQQDKYEALFGLRDVRPFEPLRGCNDFSVSFFFKNKQFCTRLLRSMWQADGRIQLTLCLQRLNSSLCLAARCLNTDNYRHPQTSPEEVFTFAPLLLPFLATGHHIHSETDTYQEIAVMWAIINRLKFPSFFLQVMIITLEVTFPRFILLVVFFPSHLSDCSLVNNKSKNNYRS